MPLDPVKVQQQPESEPNTGTATGFVEIPEPEPTPEKAWVRHTPITLYGGKKLAGQKKFKILKPHSKLSVFRDVASQPCEDLILNLGFQSKKISWSDMNSVLGPKKVPTDYGYCCFISPQIRSEFDKQNFLLES